MDCWKGLRVDELRRQGSPSPKMGQLSNETDENQCIPMNRVVNGISDAILLL